jgi:hypothetical protein
MLTNIRTDLSYWKDGINVGVISKEAAIAAYSLPIVYINETTSIFTTSDDVSNDSASGDLTLYLPPFTEFVVMSDIANDGDNATNVVTLAKLRYDSDTSCIINCTFLLTITYPDGVKFIVSYDAVVDNDGTNKMVISNIIAKYVNGNTVLPIEGEALEEFYNEMIIDSTSCLFTMLAEFLTGAAERSDEAVMVEPTNKTIRKSNAKLKLNALFKANEGPKVIYLNNLNFGSAVGDTGSIGSAKCGHRRRSHHKTLKDDRFKNHPKYMVKNGIIIKATWVGPKTTIAYGNIYTVKLKNGI